MTDEQPGLPELPDLGGLMDSLQKVQAARTQTFEGVSGGGMVRVVALGDGTFQSVEIDPECVDPNDVDLLCDLVLAALHDLTARLAEAQQEAMGALGSFDLGAMFGGGDGTGDAAE